MRLKPLLRGILAIVFAAGSSVTVLAAQDAGKLDKEAADRAHQKPALLALRRSELPDAPVLRRHAPAHRVLDGCRRLRCAPRPARRLSLRARRGDHGLERPAGEALAPARLPGRRRPLGQHGLLPGPARRQARAARRSDGPQVVRHDPVRQGREAAIEIIVAFSQARFPKALMYCPGTRAYRSPGRRPSTRPRSTTSRAASPPSSATSGPPTPAATTSTATSSSATTATRRSQVEPFTTYPPLGQRQPARPVEVDGRLRGEDRRQRAGHRAQRQPQQRPACSRSIEAFGEKPIDREYAETRAKWERLYEATQTKGDGETHPVPVAERRVRQLRALGQGQPRRQRRRRRRRCSQFEYARSALKNGLKLEAQLGVNPYKFGMIGCTDAPHRPRRRSRRTTSSARPRRRSRARSA